MKALFVVIVVSFLLSFAGGQVVKSNCYDVNDHMRACELANGEVHTVTVYEDETWNTWWTLKAWKVELGKIRAKQAADAAQAKKKAENEAEAERKGTEPF